MQTPVKMTLEEWRAAKEQWLAERTLAWPLSGNLTCGECGTRILAVAVKLQLHDRRLPGCQGDGETLETGVPYCPNCETLPKAEGCVHV
jgi:hypothetical protein